jgi:hypothetical protein
MTEGKKFDQDKLPLELIDWAHVTEIAEVLQLGKEKYGPDNWKHLTNGEDRYFAAAMRHLILWRQGETVDPESQLSHLAHAACNLMFLTYFERNR